LVPHAHADSFQSKGSSVLPLGERTFTRKTLTSKNSPAEFAQERKIQNSARVVKYRNSNPFATAQDLVNERGGDSGKKRTSNKKLSKNSASRRNDPKIGRTSSSSFGESRSSNILDFFRKK
jgi:hypothetical protein